MPGFGRRNDGDEGRIEFLILLYDGGASKVEGQMNEGKKMSAG